MNNDIMEQINRQMTYDFNSILRQAEEALMEALGSYARLSSSQIQGIMSDQSFIQTYINKHCLDIFSLGWMIGNMEKRNAPQQTVEKMGQDFRDSQKELERDLMRRFDNKKVVDVFYDLGLSFFNNGHRAGGEF
ncbi:hypothetical protein HNQ94_002185 [Salirhabdus euzebyi]|uniref:Uncharacterized protein n=1 Tax=Salirhabdus euzebyi TaxID=394506 RepID=A0A841Q5Q2_9BACI|nr:hypothetical protein [Salirhabdus euzebyi]MBB6453736.1 hypothetical protein [Salirhabdus euzebyi]